MDFLSFRERSSKRSSEISVVIERRTGVVRKSIDPFRQKLARPETLEPRSPQCGKTPELWKRSLSDVCSAETAARSSDVALRQQLASKVDGLHGGAEGSLPFHVGQNTRDSSLDSR